MKYAWVLKEVLWRSVTEGGISYRRNSSVIFSTTMESMSFAVAQNNGIRLAVRIGIATGFVVVGEPRTPLWLGVALLRNPRWELNATGPARSTNRISDGR
jgi:hypothetical protein